MFIEFKNKGILIPIILLITFVFFGSISGVLKRNVGGIFAIDYDFQIIIGLVLLTTGIIIRRIGIDYEYTNRDDERVKIDINRNELYYIPMRIWSNLFLVMGILCVIGGIIETVIRIGNK